MRGAMAPTILIVLLQCYATRTGSGCAALQVFERLAECRPVAAEYQRFDSSALRRTGVPVVVSYRCVERSL